MRRRDEKFDRTEERGAAHLIDVLGLLKSRTRSVVEKLLADIEDGILIKGQGNLFQTSVEFHLIALVVSRQIELMEMKRLIEANFMIELQMILVDHHGDLPLFPFDLDLVPLIVDQIQLFARDFVDLIVPTVFHADLTLFQSHGQQLIEELKDQSVVMHRFQLKFDQFRRAADRLRKTIVQESFPR